MMTTSMLDKNPKHHLWQLVSNGDNSGSLAPGIINHILSVSPLKRSDFKKKDRKKATIHARFALDPLICQDDFDSIEALMFELTERLANAAGMAYQAWKKASGASLIDFRLAILSKTDAKEHFNCTERHIGGWGEAIFEIPVNG